MITNDEELDTTLDRIRQFQMLISTGFLAELDRMQLEIRQYFSETPAQAEHGRVG